LSATDADGNTLTYSIVTGPKHGTISGFNASTGTFVYTAADGFTGTDTIRYGADDSFLGHAEANVVISVLPVNTKPVATSIGVAANAGHAQTITLPAGQDAETPSANLTLVVLTQPALGSLQVTGQNTLVYTARPGTSGADQFTYGWRDTGTGGAANALTSDPATVSITVTNTNHPPIAVADQIAANQDMPLQIAVATLLANDVDLDSDPLTVISLANVTGGSAAYDAAHGTILFTPAAGFSGVAGFDYTIADPSNAQATAHVEIDVAAAPKPPLTEADSYSVKAGGVLTVAAAQGVLANDTDPQGASLSASLVTGPSHGQLSFAADGSFTYVADSSFIGTDTFTYKAADSTLESAATTVSIALTPSTTGPDTLVLNVSGDNYGGPAQFVVAVDGTQVGGVQNVTASHAAGATQAITLNGTFGANPKAVTVTFVNDLYAGTPGQDRNLYVSSVTLNGVTYAGSSAIGSTVAADGSAELLSNGSISIGLTPPSTGPDTLVLNVSGDNYGGPAQFVVAVDGTQVGGVQNVTASHAAGATQAITLNGTFGANPKAVTVTFVNDLYTGTPGQDRNLYVSSVTLNGVTYASLSGPATLFSNGSVTIALTLPAAPALEVSGAGTVAYPAPNGVPAGPAGPNVASGAESDASTPEGVPSLSPFAASVPPQVLERDFGPSRLFEGPLPAEETTLTQMSRASIDSSGQQPLPPPEPPVPHPANGIGVIDALALTGLALRASSHKLPAARRRRVVTFNPASADFDLFWAQEEGEGDLKALADDASWEGLPYVTLDAAE
jgi:VCBS repeat-containing protein